jgi:hypothetical protein
MPNYYVTVNRPVITAVTPAGAADSAISTPLTSSDIVYVKELAQVGDTEVVTFTTAGATFKVTGGSQAEQLAKQAGA